MLSTGKKKPIFIVCAIAAAVVVLAIVVPAAVRQQRINGFLRQNENSFILDESGGQCIVSVGLTQSEDSSNTVEFSSFAYFESEDFAEKHPEIFDSYETAIDTIDQTVNGFEKTYPGQKAIKCSIDSFSETGMAITFYGEGTLPDGTQEEVNKKMDFVFASAGQPE